MRLNFLSRKTDASPSCRSILSKKILLGSMRFPKFLRIVVRFKKEIVKANETTSATKVTLNAVDVELTKIFAQALHFSYQLLIAEDGELGRQLDNGTWTGMVGVLERNEADIAVSILSPSQDRLGVVDFSYPHDKSHITFATRMPKYTPQPTSFLRPLSVGVWLLVLVCLVIMPLLFYAFFRGRCPLDKLVLAVYSTFVQKCLVIDPRAAQEYVLVVSWQVGVMFLSYCYTAVLLSFLTLPPLEGVRTIPELAAAVASGKYQCTNYPGSFITHSLLSSNDSQSRTIGLNLHQKEPSSDIDGVLGDRGSGKVPAFVANADYLLPLKYRYFISQDSFAMALRGIAMRKGFCCRSHIDHVIGYVWNSGIYRKLLGDTEFLVTLKKLPSPSSSSKERELSVEDFVGAFILLISGYILGLIVLTFELVYCKFAIVSRKYPQRKDNIG